MLAFLCALAWTSGPSSLSKLAQIVQVLYPAGQSIAWDGASDVLY